MEDSFLVSSHSKQTVNNSHQSPPEAPRLHSSAILSSYEIYPIETTKNIPLFQPTTEYRKHFSLHALREKSAISPDSIRYKPYINRDLESTPIKNLFQLSSKLHSPSCNKAFPARRLYFHSKSPHIVSNSESKLERVAAYSNNLSVLERLPIVTCDSSSSLPERTNTSKSSRKSLPLLKKARFHKGYTGLRSRANLNLRLKPWIEREEVSKGMSKEWYKSVMNVRSLCR
jgi:hypothetical protein